MAKFKFRLATLLRLRETVRDDRRTELAEAYRVDNALQEQVNQVEREMGRVREKCRRAAAPGRIDVDRLVETQRYELTLSARHGHLGQQREVVAAEIQRRQQRLVEANREVRVLEKLRQKQAVRHRREENRREVRLLDEVAGRRTAREDIR